MNQQLPTEILTFLSIVISVRYIFKFTMQGILKITTTLRDIKKAHELIEFHRQSFEGRFEQLEKKVEKIEQTVFKIYEHITK